MVDLVSSDGDEERAIGERLSEEEEEEEEGGGDQRQCQRKQRPSSLPREATIHLFVSTQGIYESEERRATLNAAVGDCAEARRDSWAREPGGGFYMVQCSTHHVGSDPSTCATFEERPRFAALTWKVHGRGLECDPATNPEGWTVAAHSLFVIFHGLQYVYAQMPCGVSLVVHVDRGVLWQAEGDAPAPELRAIEKCKTIVRRFNRDGGRVHFNHYTLPLAMKYRGGGPRVRAQAMASMYGLASRPHWSATSSKAETSTANYDKQAPQPGHDSRAGEGEGVSKGMKEEFRTSGPGRNLEGIDDDDEVIEVVVDDEDEDGEDAYARKGEQQEAVKDSEGVPLGGPTFPSDNAASAEPSFTSPEKDSRGWGWGWAHHIRDRATGGLRCPACERVYRTVAALKSHAAQQVDPGHVNVERILSSRSRNWREELVSEMMNLDKVRTEQREERVREQARVHLEKSRQEKKRRIEREAELEREEARYFANARARMQAAQRAAVSTPPRVTTPEDIRALSGKTEDLDAEISRIVAAGSDVDALCFARGSTAEELKKIFRAYGLVLHPDKCQRPRAAEAFQRISSAYTKMCEERGKQGAPRFASRTWAGHGQFQGDWGWGWNASSR